MAITATFEADFQPFLSETQKATTALKTLETGASSIPQQFTRLETATSKTARAVGTFSTGLGQVDRTLAAFGLNITPQLAALREMETLAAAAAAGFSGIGLAALGVGAALVAWNTDWEKVHKTIGDATAKLLGWGDVQAQTKAAIQESAEATKRLGEQAKIAAEEEKKLAEATKEARDRMHRHLEDRLKDVAEQVKKEAEAERKKAEQLAQTEKEWRDYQNFLGERIMEDEAKRLEQQTAKHKAETAKKIAEEKKWWDTVNQGVLVVGAAMDATMSELQRPQSLLTATPLNQRGVEIFTGAGGPAVSFGGQAGAGGGPMRFGFTGQSGVVGTINIDARGAFLPTTTSVQQFGRIAGDAIIARQRATGSRA